MAEPYLVSKKYHEISVLAGEKQEGKVSETGIVCYIYRKPENLPEGNKAV